MRTIQLWQATVIIGFMGCLSVWTAKGEELKIVIDNRPESGIPAEALAQENCKETAAEKALAAKGWPVKFHSLTSGTIKSVRIRYFNKETWSSEKEVRECVSGFLGNKASEVFGFQAWSQGLEVPEIECLIEFTEEYQKKLIAEGKECREGRLLIWNTESCFRDATGRWYFVTAFDQFHRAHPKGDRKLVEEAKPK